MPRQEDDDLITPLVLSRYRQLGVIPGWETGRFLKLCGLANRTPEEVGAMAGLMPFQTRNAMAEGRFKPPVSLHFVMIEKAFLEQNFSEPWEAVVPMDLLDKK